jgi:hypothetical protein
MKNKKKLSLIVKSEETFGISLWVDKDFDEEYNSDVMKKLLNDFPRDSRRTIFPERDEVEMMNEGEMKNEPKFYLTKDGVVKSLTV